MQLRYHVFKTKEDADIVEEVSDLSAIPRKDEYVQFGNGETEFRVYKIVWRIWKKVVWIGLTKQDR